MNKLLTIAIILMLPGIASAHDRHGWGGSSTGGVGYYSSTAAEGLWRGFGAFGQGLASFSDSLGRFMVNHERARQMYIENNKKEVEADWALQDANDARRVANSGNLIQKRHKQLDKAIELHHLKQRENELRQKGILPAKPEQVFTYDGKSYTDYKDFRSSPDWVKMRVEAKNRTMIYNMNLKSEAQKQQEALNFLANWNRMNHLERQRYIWDRDLEKMVEGEWKETYTIIKKKK